jgi:hypothetical protein
MWILWDHPRRPCGRRLSHDLSRRTIHHGCPCTSAETHFEPGVSLVAEIDAAALAIAQVVIGTY